MNRSALLLIASAIVYIYPAIAGTEVAHRRVRDTMAKATFTMSEGQNACQGKYLEISAAETRVQEDGQSATTPSVGITYSVYNYCDGKSEMTTWYGESTDALVQIDSSLKFARVTSPSFAVTDIGGSVPRTIDLIVDVRWSSNDQVDKITGTWADSWPGWHLVSLLNGTYRNAAAEGTVSDGVTNWVPVIPNTASAQLCRIMSGNITVTKD